jgi:hypothetical protein
MKNVTVTLAEDLALWLRIRAAENDRSVSSWLGELIAGWKRREDEYQLAMERYLAAEPEKLKQPGDRYPTRESLHDRAGLR